MKIDFLLWTLDLNFDRFFGGNLGFLTVFRFFGFFRGFVGFSQKILNKKELKNCKN
jgi:hypothetical protein